MKLIDESKYFKVTDPKHIYLEGEIYRFGMYSQSPYKVVGKNTYRTGKAGRTIVRTIVFDKLDHKGNSLGIKLEQRWNGPDWGYDVYLSMNQYEKRDHDQIEKSKPKQGKVVKA